MGIPYSRQINTAFSQVQPLVASGFEVLETTKNIAVALFVIQILSVILLSFILVALLGLLFTLNPDLEPERKAIVTPVMKWIASWIKGGNGVPWWVAAGMVFIFVGAGLGFGGWVYYKRNVEDVRVSWEDGAKFEGESDEVGEGSGKDVDNLRSGSTSQ